MKKLFLVFFVALLMFQVLNGQIPFNRPDIILHPPLNKTLAKSNTYVSSINLTGTFNELVIVFGFPDRTHLYPTLENNSTYPLLGAFPDGQLLSNYVANHGGSISADVWFQPALTDYFTRESGGDYIANFLFPKKINGEMYLTTKTFAGYVTDNGGSSNAVVYNRRNDIAVDIIRNIYAISPSLFTNIQMIHIVPFGITKDEFNKPNGCWAEPWEHIISTAGGTEIYRGPLDFQNDLHAIPHEKLHVIGTLSGSPSGFRGFPDRGYESYLRIAGEHNNLLWNYDMMYHNAATPEEHSLYGFPPLLSHDLIFLGWIRPDEILTVRTSNIGLINFSSVKLADVNNRLTTQQINDGYRRIIKVMINENYSGDKDEYYLIEYHKASGYDKNFTNYDEFASGFNQGVLVWHIKENQDIIDIFSDNLIDLEVAVPYNGWNGSPLPNDSYPRDNANRIASFNGQHAGDFDYLDDDLRSSVIGTYLPDGGYVFTHMPDGGRNIWEFSNSSVVYPWWPTDPNLPRANPTPFMRLSSQKSDFFTDEIIKGLITNRMTMGTRPSTKSWNGTLIPTPIAITNIHRENDYMKLNVYYNYWEGPLSQSTTWSGNITVGNNFVIPAGVTLTIAAGSNIKFSNGASLIVNGTLIANGTSSSRIKFDFVSKNSGIKFYYTGSEGSITYADIKNAYSAVDCYEASPTLLNNSFYNSEIGLNCQYNSSPTLAGYYLNGNNIITNNVRGINASYNCNPFVGGTYGGLNSIYGNSQYNISAYYGCSIYAQNTWWGNFPLTSQETSKILQYQSTIDYSHAWQTDPNLGRPLSKVSFAGSTGNSGQEDELVASLYLQMQEKYDEAIASYGKLISKDLKSSKSTYALSKLSECYEKTGRKDFIDFLNKSIRTKSSKDDQISITALELENFWLMKQGRYTEAIKAIGKIKADYKENKDTYKYALFNEGYIYFVFLNDVAKAKESYAELGEKYPDDALTAESKIIMGGTPGGGYSVPKNIANDDSDNKIPETYALLGNYPNPFNPSTTIRYAIPRQSLVEVKIYNIMGNEVKSFTMNSQAAGYHNLLWDGKNMNNEQVASGTYIYRLRAVSYEAGEVFEKSAKMLIIK